MTTSICAFITLMTVTLGLDKQELNKCSTQQKLYKRSVNVAKYERAVSSMYTGIIFNVEGNKFCELFGSGMASLESVQGAQHHKTQIPDCHYRSIN